MPRPLIAPRSPLPGLALWIIAMVVISIMVIRAPQNRTLITLYREAATAWQAEQPLYEGPLGMNYLPHFPALFTPLHQLPEPVPDVLWRVIAGAWIALGMWMLVRRLDHPRPGEVYFWTSACAIAGCLAALRNGQANAMLGAVILQSVVLLMYRRWNLAALCLLLALAIKPLAIVLVLLVPLGYPRLIWRLVLGLPALAASLFLIKDPAYVLSQYKDALSNLAVCSRVTEHRFASLGGIVRSLGVEPNHQAVSILAAIVGVAVAAVWWHGARRCDEPRRGLLLLVLATAYLMLFNPMNEINSFVIFTPAAAVAAAYLADTTRARILAIVMLLLVATIGTLPEIVRPVSPTWGLWWNPAIAIVFIIAVPILCLKAPATNVAVPRPAA